MGGEGVRIRGTQSSWAASQLCMCVLMSACVVMALQILWPHVNYICNRGLLLSWTEAQEKNKNKHRNADAQKQEIKKC